MAAHESQTTTLGTHNCDVSSGQSTLFSMSPWEPQQSFPNAQWREDPHLFCRQPQTARTPTDLFGRKLTRPCKRTGIASRWFAVTYCPIGSGSHMTTCAFGSLSSTAVVISQYKEFNNVGHSISRCATGAPRLARRRIAIECDASCGCTEQGRQGSVIALG